MSFLPRAMLRNPAFVAAGGGGPTFINSFQGASSGGLTSSRPLGFTVASGDSLHVLMKHAGTNTGSTLTDDKGNTYTSDYNDTSNGIQFWSCFNITNGPSTLTWTNTVSDAQTGTVLEFSGLSAVSVAGVDHAPASGTTYTATVTTLVSNEVVFGMTSRGTMITVTANGPSGAVNLPAFGTASQYPLVYYVAGTAGAQIMSQTVATSLSSHHFPTISYKP